MNVTKNFSLEKLRRYQLETCIKLTRIKDQNNRKVFTRISNILTGILFALTRLFSEYRDNTIIRSSDS